MTGDATQRIVATIIDAGMYVPGFDALADALCEETPHIPFSTPQIEACAVVALSLHLATQQAARRTPAPESLHFDDYPGDSPARRIHTRQYNAALDRLWLDHITNGGDATNAALLRVASDALVITNARLTRT